MPRRGPDISHGGEAMTHDSLVITCALRRARRCAEGDGVGWVPCQLRIAAAGPREREVDQAKRKVIRADREKPGGRGFSPLLQMSWMLCVSGEASDVPIATSGAALSESNDLESGHHV